MNRPARGVTHLKIKHRATLLAAAVAAAAAGGALSRADITAAPDQPAATAPGDIMTRSVDSDLRVRVDESFDANKTLKDAMNQERRHNTKLAAQAYQGVVEKFGQKLIFVSDDYFQSVADFARSKLLAMQADGGTAYDQLYNLTAQSLIDSAITDHDQSKLVQACDRYFPSTAAVKGAQQAAAWYFEAGQFEEAARLWRSLLNHPKAKDQRAETLHHAALAEYCAGRTQDARALRAELAKDFPDATGQVAGRDVNWSKDLDAVFARLPATAFARPPLGPDQWPVFGGDERRSAVADVTASAGARLWSVDISDKADAESHPQTPAPRAIGIGRRGAGLINGNIRVRGRMGMAADNNSNGDDGDQMLGSQPVMADGQLFVNTGDHLLAISGGNTLWTYPPAGTNREAGNNAFTGLVYFQHNAPAVDGNDVFAIVPAVMGNPGNTPSFNRAAFYSPYGPVQANRLVCINRQESVQDRVVERWGVNSTSVVTNTQSQGAFSFSGSPIVAPDAVYMLGRKAGGDVFSQVYLVRLNRTTGAVEWSTYLCSSSNNNYSVTICAALGSYAGGTVYVDTGEGAVCAVDGNLGRIKWLHITDAGHLNGNASAAYHSVNLGDTTPWKFNAPVVWGDKVLMIDPGNAVTVYERPTGKVAGVIKSDAELMLGVVDGTLYTLGSKVRATSLDTLAVRWESSDFRSEWGKQTGRPFLAQRYLYVPFEHHLVTYETGSGKLHDATPWPADAGGTPGHAGNLLVTSEQVITVTDDEIAGYARWETALQSGQDKIHLNPTSFEPYLKLAEISFRTGHYDLAQDMMGKAIDLATAGSGANGASGSAGGVSGAGSSANGPSDDATLGRLFGTNLTFANQLMTHAADPESALRARARFYFDGCRRTARTPDQNVQWRLALAPLSLAQNKTAEAADFYNQVLTDATLREATYQDAERTEKGKVHAESDFRALIAKFGRTVYQPYEDQAQAALAKAGANLDLLKQVKDSYPNSQAAVKAGRQLADAYRGKNDPRAQTDVLLWMNQEHHVPASDKTAKAQILADLIDASLARKHFDAARAYLDRGLRQFATTQVTYQQQPQTFETLAQAVRQSTPQTASTRRPILSLPLAPDSMNESNGQRKARAQGLLLVPAEKNPAFRKPDGFMAFNSGKVTYYDSATLEPKWSADTPDGSAVVLLGYADGNAILASPRTVLAVNATTGKIAWRTTDFDEPTRNNAAQQQAVQMRALAMQGNGPPGFQQQQFNNDGTPTLPFAPADEELARLQQFQRLSSVRYNSLRLMKNKLVKVADNTVDAWDLSTGKRVWHNPYTLPEGFVSAVVGNDDLIVAQVDNAEAAAPSFVLINAEDGTFRGAIKLSQEHVLWRALSEEGKLFLVSDQAVSAYDVYGDLNQPIWSNNKIHSPYPAASALTPDGLMVFDDNNLICLTPDGGDADPRWATDSSTERRPPLPLNNVTGRTFNDVRTAVEGDDILVQSSSGIVAYQTATGRRSWTGEFVPDQTPPLVDLALTDAPSPSSPPSTQPQKPAVHPLAVVLAMGPVPNANVAHGVSLDIFDRRENNGKHLLNQRINTDNNSGEGPAISAWQVIDNGVVFQYLNDIYVDRSKK